jgi:hypothetical protein
MNIEFSHWLSKKLYLINIGLYATISIVMILLPILKSSLGLHPILVSFVVFLIVSFLRAAYESIIVYEAPVTMATLLKLLILALATAGAMSAIAFFIKPYVGWFSLPIAIMTSFIFVKRLKIALWPSTTREGFFSQLPEKLQLQTFGFYGFCAILAGLAIIGYSKLGLKFEIAFSIALFVAMIFEELYNSIKIYEQKPTLRNIALTTVWSSMNAIVATALVITLITKCGLPEATGTVLGITIIKLIQPLGSRKILTN